MSNIMQSIDCFDRGVRDYGNKKGIHYRLRGIRNPVWSSFDQENASRRFKVGLEVGFDKNAQQQIKEFLRDKDFDFIIGSLHRAEGLDLFNGDFFRGKRAPGGL